MIYRLNWYLELLGAQVKKKQPVQYFEDANPPHTTMVSLITERERKALPMTSIRVGMRRRMREHLECFFMTSTCIRERRNFAGSTFREDFGVFCSVILSSGDYKTWLKKTLCNICWGIDLLSNVKIFHTWLHGYNDYRCGFDFHLDSFLLGC